MGLSSNAKTNKSKNFARKFRRRQMKTVTPLVKMKIKGVIAFGMLSAASLTLLFALPTQQPNNNPRAESEVTVPSTVSSSSDNGGMRTRADTVLPSVRYGWNPDPNAASVTLEPLDIRSVTMKAPNQIGANRSVAVLPKTRAQKFVNPDGSQIIVVIIKSSGASAIGVHFRNFALAAGDEVYVYGPAADSIVFGPYTNKGPWGSNEFWSGTIVGDRAVIEFHTRTDEKKKGFEIFEISHIFPELDWRLQSDQPDVLNCEVDASCYGEIQKNAVGRFVYNDNGAFVCTGTLLNDVAQDHIPYFLTANHCVPTQAVAQTVEVYWFYQTTGCDSGVLRNWVHSPPGANLLATQPSNDFALLRLLNNAPAGAFFSAWTTGVQPTGTGVFGLHHPGGYTPPDLPSYLRRASGTIISTNENCPDSGLQNGYRVAWISGTTEPGSSGSGLWNSNGYLVGVDSCGSGTCNTPNSWYSKFANFYSQIQQYIGSGTPTPSAKSDFNRDGKPDYLLYNAGTRKTAVWYLNNNAFIGGAFAPTLPVGWRVIDVADFNRDGRPDYALFNASTRQSAIWYLSGVKGVTFIGSAWGPILPGGWALVATGEFNNDGKPDYVIYNASTRQTAIWYLNNNMFIGGAYGPSIPAGWSLVGIADFNRDGKPDYLLFNPSTHYSVIWYLSGATRIGSAFGPTIAAGYNLIGTSDFNRDGKPDYLLFNPSTRGTAIWYLNNNVRIATAVGPTLAAGYTLAAP
jgi:Trypsin-like peptidase domain/FG-GAP-like repeat